MFDILIRGGTIIDGTKAPRYRGDLGIRGDRVAKIGDLQEDQAHTEIDAAGKIVAPGFVDVHNHSDGWMLKTTHLAPKTLQGFTTEILMADGISYAPVDANTARQWLFYLQSLNALRMDEYRGWESLAEFMACIEGNNVQNAATHIPYANARSLACGFGRQRVDDYQMKRIQATIRQGMDEGAVGLSTGLDYIVQCFSTTDELVAACSAMQPQGGLYVTHIRYKLGILPALREAVQISRRAGVPLHISHLREISPQDVDQVLTYIDQEARKEVDLSFDVYPYQCGSTMLNMLLPYEVWEDGPLAAIDKLRRPETRARFRQGLQAYHFDLNKMRIAWVSSKENTRHQGKLLSQYVDEVGLPAEDALCDLLIEERLGVSTVFISGEDHHVEPFLAHDLYMMGSDGLYFPDGHVHPRVYGSAARLLGPCVRDRKLFSLEEAVRKLSGWPAQRFRLHQRGTLQEGNYADVVVFDPLTITDHATYDQPRQYSTGVQSVLVNGVPIIQDGTPIESIPAPLPGRYLRYS